MSKPCNKTLCYFCKRKITKSYLNDHLKLHTKELIHKCNHCNQLCTSKHILNAHVKNVHSGKNFKCCLCQKLFKTNVHVKEHQKSVHFKEKCFPCEICGKGKKIRHFYFR